ncbi:MAG: cyclophilin [Gammaproteobacteria bacterium RIFCSPHIGHO2_12_FULL_45_9]|nr:MAG: cyclophilin [Gammaproteobacteria bacterium RIFCSPHIGHO2_12_FULL_45_9]
MITLKTNFGDISIELDSKNTPVTAENFLSYAKSGFYDGTIFHRVMNDFMIQGGGFDASLSQKKTSAAIPNEANKGGKNLRGTIAMARTADPHSATAQFFINVVDNDFLNFTAESGNGWGYCVFGNVSDGLDVVDAIKKVSTTNQAGHQNVPVDPVIIEKVIVLD